MQDAWFTVPEGAIDLKVGASWSAGDLRLDLFHAGEPVCTAWQPRQVCEIPFPQSGDWAIRLSSYAGAYDVGVFWRASVEDPGSEPVEQPVFEGQNGDDVDFGSFPLADGGRLIVGPGSLELSPSSFHDAWFQVDGPVPLALHTSTVEVDTAVRVYDATGRLLVLDDEGGARDVDHADDANPTWFTDIHVAPEAPLPWFVNVRGTPRFGSEAGLTLFVSDDVGRAPAPHVSGPAGQVVITEVFANADEVDDTNCDGAADGEAESFVEVQNQSEEPVSLTGWRLRTFDGDTGFPDGSLLQPGDLAVVWFGGPTSCPSSPGVHTFSVEDDLGGDGRSGSVWLLDADGSDVDLVAWWEPYQVDRLHTAMVRSPVTSGVGVRPHVLLYPERYSPGWIAH